MKSFFFWVLALPSFCFFLSVYPAESEPLPQSQRQDPAATATKMLPGEPADRGTLSRSVANSLSQELTPSSFEFEEVMAYPLLFSPSAGIEVKRYENSEERVEAGTGIVLVKGNAEVRIGSFEILDNTQDRLRLVMDSKTNARKMQLEGLLPAVGRLASEIAGDVDTADGKYSGVLRMNFSRLRLYHYLNRDEVAFRFEYSYRKDNVLYLEGDLPPLKISGFSFLPENLRLRRDALLFDFRLHDPGENVSFMIRDYPLIVEGPRQELFFSDILFLGHRIKGVSCWFRDPCVKLSFHSDFLGGSENDVAVEFYPDGSLRFLNTFKLASGAEIVFTGPFIFYGREYAGGIELNLKWRDGEGAVFTGDKVRMDLNGGLRGEVSLAKGQYEGFSSPGTTFDLALSKQAGLKLKPVAVPTPVSSAPASEPEEVPRPSGLGV